MDLTKIDRVAILRAAVAVTGDKSKRLFASRLRALLHYRARADRLNDLRRMPTVCRRVLRSTEFNKRRARLLRAARKVLGANTVDRRIKRTLRRRFEKAMGAKVESRVVLALTGASLYVVRQHLEAQFKPGMSWDNHGLYGWHIDHKRPLAQFDLTDPQEATKAFHYTNLQPLWAGENLSKGARV